MKNNKRKVDKNMPLKDSIRGVVTQPQSIEIIREKLSHHILAISLILIISIAIYSNTLKNGFVFDDETTIVNNTFIKNINNLPKLYSRTDYFLASEEISYRPVVTLTYFIEYAIYGLKPYGFHFTNLILHTINGIILYIFLFQLSAFSHQLSLSLYPSAFFHPLSLSPIRS